MRLGRGPRGALERDARPAAPLRRVAPGGRRRRAGHPHRGADQLAHRAPAAPARPARDRARHRGDHRPRRRVAALGRDAPTHRSHGPLRRRARRRHAAAAGRSRARRRASACSRASSATWRATSRPRSPRCVSSASGSRRSCAAWSRACSSPTSTAASCCSNARARELLGLPPGRRSRPGARSSSSCAIPASPRSRAELASGQPVVSRDVTLGGTGRSLQVNGARLTAEDGDAVRPRARAARRLRAAPSRDGAARLRRERLARAAHPAHGDQGLRRDAARAGRRESRDGAPVPRR